MEPLGATFAPGVAWSSKANSATLSALLLVLWMMTFIVVGIFVVYARSVFNSGRLPFLKPSKGNVAAKDERVRSSKRKAPEFRAKKYMSCGPAMVLRQRRGNGVTQRTKRAYLPKRFGDPFASTLTSGSRATGRDETTQKVNSESVSERSDSFDDTAHIPQVCQQLLRTSAPKPLQPAVTEAQLATQEHCRQLLLELQRLKLRLGNDVNMPQESDTNQETLHSCKTGLKRVRSLFEEFQTRYAGDRLGYTRVMILCCNVIMALDALPLMKSLQSLDEEAAEDAQWIIETVVPHIWAF